MCKWSPLFAAFKLMCECANAWSMCKCVVNVQMCECANVQIVALNCCASLRANAQLCKGDNLHICTFSHLHINQAFAH